MYKLHGIRLSYLEWSKVFAVLRIFHVVEFDSVSQT
jgi:hypothetical protein